MVRPEAVRLLAAEWAVVRWTRRLSLSSGWLLLGMSILTVVDASLRYALTRPLPATAELTELMLATVMFLGLPTTGLTDPHLTVDVLARRWRPRSRYALAAAAGLVMTALLATITGELLSLAAEMGRTSRTTIAARIPLFPFMVPPVLAAGAAVLGSLIHAIGAMVRMVRPQLPPPPSASA